MTPQQARQAAIQVASEDLATQTFLTNQAAEAAAKLAAQPQIDSLQATATSAIASAVGVSVGSDVVAALSGGRTRQATVKSVSLQDGKPTFVLTVQGVVTANYDETVSEDRVLGSFTTDALTAAKLFRANLNVQKGLTPGQAAKKAGKAEQAAFNLFTAQQAAAAAAAKAALLATATGIPSAS
jgi:hypothetical protein